ncbi:VOC family protein [Nocardia wallacei]|uniref:VOC family protein n=1 Tax=Nocardia wallacei TaxID=480035 RepID=UPI002458E0B4|nr:VOC family protein [Nocardia wallacei]
MKPATVIVSLPVADSERALRFYHDGLGLAPAEVDESIIAFELPNLSLFLIEYGEYEKYTSRAGITPRLPAPGACSLSCAIGSKEELDDILGRATAAGASVARPAGEYDGSYMGYFSDPDGHLWELVVNAQTEAAATAQ